MKNLPKGGVFFFYPQIFFLNHCTKSLLFSSVYNLCGFFATSVDGSFILVCYKTATLQFCTLVCRICSNSLGDYQCFNHITYNTRRSKYFQSFSKR